MQSPFLRTACAAALVALAGFASPAYAQPVYNWTGFYAGIHGGSAWGNAKGSDTGLGPSTETDQSLSGGFGGGQFGYNVQFGRAVFGVELSASYGNISRSGNCFVGLGALPFLNCETKQDWSLQFLSRLGYAAGDGRLLPYVVGGVVFSDVKIRRENTIALDTWGSTHTTPGGAIGAGLQYAFGNGFSIGVEYLYVQYFNQNYSSVSACGCVSAGEQTLGTQSLRVSLNYTFGSPPPVNPGSDRISGPQSGVYDWTGFYVGGHTGWNRAHRIGGEQENVSADHQTYDTGLSGAQIGYNYQIGRFVIGAEISGSLPWKGSSWAEACDGFGFVDCRMRQEWSSQFLARLGYAAGDGRFLPYVAAGVALTRLKLSYEAFGVPYGTASTMPGVVFGAGFQYAFGNGWSAGLEYLYTSYANQDFSSVAHTGFPGDYSDDQSRLTTQTVRFVANYKFGGTSQAQNSPAYNWTGFYIGVHGSYEDIWSKGSDVTPLILAGCCGLTDQQIRGASGGVQLGYNFQAGRAVLGTEISFSAGSLSRTGDCLSINPALDVSCRLKAEWTGRLLARLGYAFGDGRFVPYLAGGLAFTQFNTARSFDDGFGPITSGGTQIATGVIAGLGLQYAITNDLSLGIEYLFTQYSAVRDANFNQGTVSSQNISSDTARVVLNYRFDSGAR